MIIHTVLCAKALVIYLEPQRKKRNFLVATKQLSKAEYCISFGIRCLNTLFLPMKQSPKPNNSLISSFTGQRKKTSLITYVYSVTKQNKHSQLHENWQHPYA